MRGGGRQIEDDVLLLKQLLSNNPLISASLAWFFTQGFKLIVHYRLTRKVNFRLWTSSGGMPSSHSATVCALSASVALHEGLGSTLFAITLFFAIFVIYDAAVVRRASGYQAEALNKIMAKVFEAHTLSERQLKELIGHTPLQVLIGIFVGIFVACLQAWFVVA